ncbi:hypothetical protein [Methylobrevis pamukkalensis]|uniref:Uncharacterized protein n=1 Tax=Methylobrevis pamukkalensis TaxID=1439726 RepID=A0A1E3H8D1_9HYPH|nr:hypothetical protein [Methylobrevis pamukkalensis]ODN72415.1 hypothetical protein A6302_00161 [Methylobrevis pamukkalensis]
MAVAGAGLVLAFGLAACARPEGDFGRADPSWMHDELMPAAGRLNAAKRGEPVSSFNRTDTERLLADQAWALISPPAADAWWTKVLVEGQRIRILPPVDARFDPASYYIWLQETPFRSSEARWSKVIADLYSDADLVPPFCETVLKVRRADGERIAAIGRQLTGEEVWIRNAGARVAENEALIAWVGRALIYRLKSYRNAIDRLEIETPSNQLFAANRASIPSIR